MNYHSDQSSEFSNLLATITTVFEEMMVGIAEGTYGLEQADYDIGEHRYVLRLSVVPSDKLKSGAIL